MPETQQNRRSQLVRNVFYGVMAWLLPIIPTLFATRIVLAKLGKEQYGILTLLLGFVSYFFTVAIGKVAAKYVAEFLSADNEDAVSPVISATLILSCGGALVCTLLVAAAAGPIVDDVLKIGGPLREDAVVGVYLASATVLATAAAQTFILLLQGLHRFGRYFLLANFTSVSFSIGGLVLAWIGYGFIQILIWNLVTWCLAGAAAIVFVRKSLPGFRFTLQIPKDVWLLVTRYAASIIGYQLFGSALLLFERGWIMRNLGSEAVTFYVVPMALAMYIHAFISSLVLSMFPTLNELLGQPEKLRALYARSTKIVLAVVMLATVTSAVCGAAFLTVWLKDPRVGEISAGLLVIHTVTFSIVALNTVAWHIAEGFRAARLNAYATFVWTVIAVAAIVLLGPRWGIDGVGTARLIGVLPFVPMIFLVEHRYLGAVDWAFWMKCVAQLSICAAVAGGLEFALISVLGAGWISVSLAVVLGSAMYCVGCVVVKYISAAELTDYKNLLLRRGLDTAAPPGPA